MKAKFLVSLIALIAVLVLPSVLATGSLSVNIDSATIKGVELAPGATTNIAGFSGETVPLKVIVSSSVDVADAKVKAWIGGYRDDISASTRKIHLLNNSVYSELMSVKLPSDIDSSESYTLYVRVETKDSYKEEQFNLKIQRESYEAKILYFDSEKVVRAGEKLAVSVVLKNLGYEELEDLFVSVSIPELGVEKRAYFEDLTPEDDADEDKRDSAERTIYLKIPSDAKAGVYDLRVESYNADSKDIRTGKIAVISGNEESRVIAPITSKNIAVGSTESFDIVVVNSGSSVAVYEIIPESNDNLIISGSQIVTVKAGSSETAKLNVKAVKEGTYNFAVSVESDGKLVKKVSLSAVAEKKAFSSNIVILTIVLIIVLVVLAIVLIVLLTRKPSRNEVEESYY